MTLFFLKLCWKYSEGGLHSGNLFAERKSASLLIFPGQRIHDTRNTTTLYPSSKLHRLYRALAINSGRVIYIYISIYIYRKVLQCLFCRACTLPWTYSVKKTPWRFMGVGNPWQDKVTHRLAEEGRTDRRRRRRRELMETRSMLPFPPLFVDRTVGWIVRTFARPFIFAEPRARVSSILIPVEWRIWKICRSRRRAPGLKSFCFPLPILSRVDGDGIDFNRPSCDLRFRSAVPARASIVFRIWYVGCRESRITYRFDFTDTYFHFVYCYVIVPEHKKCTIRKI